MFFTPRLQAIKMGFCDLETCNEAFSVTSLAILVPMTEWEKNGGKIAMPDLLPKYWKVEKTTSIEQCTDDTWRIECRILGGRAFDFLMKETNHFRRKEIYVESAGGVRPRRFKLTDVTLVNYVNFDKRGTRLVVFEGRALEKVEMKVPRMWRAHCGEAEHALG